MKLEFVVYGTPQPQGSTRAFMPKGAKYPIITSDNPKLKSWRQELAKTALLACCELPKDYDFPRPKGIAMQVSARFYFKSPKKTHSQHKTTRPDADKLLRAALDGMTGIVYEDDSQVAHAQVSKLFGLPERCEIYAATME